MERKEKADFDLVTKKLDIAIKVCERIAKDKSRPKEQVDAAVKFLSSVEPFKKAVFDYTESAFKQSTYDKKNESEVMANFYEQDRSNKHDALVKSLMEIQTSFLTLFTRGMDDFRDLVGDITLPANRLLFKSMLFDGIYDGKIPSNYMFKDSKRLIKAYYKTEEFKYEPIMTDDEIAIREEIAEWSWDLCKKFIEISIFDEGEKDDSTIRRKD